MAEGKNLKVAIVCDWLTGIGGAERVVLELHKLFPDAPIYTSQYDPAKIDWFRNAEVRTTWLQRLPKGLKKFLPVLRAWTFSRLDLRAYDLVISSSGAEAKAVKTGQSTLHISYCHSPTHYYWIRYGEYLKYPGFPRGFNWLARLGLRLLVGPLKRWDKRAAQRPNYLIANSTHTQAMIKKYYGRDSTVIHPPVDVARFANPQSQLVNPRKGFVAAGRQTPYKRIDLAVAACTKLRLPLTVIGDGPDHAKLVAMAGPTITFQTDASDVAIVQHFQMAEAFIFPGMDDFGIVAVEAMAAGTPVIAYKNGGALDYVKEDETGLFFTEQTAESLAHILQVFALKTFDSAKIQQWSQQFSMTAFRNQLKTFITSVLNQ